MRAGHARCGNGLGQDADLIELVEYGVEWMVWGKALGSVVISFLFTSLLQRQLLTEFRRRRQCVAPKFATDHQLDSRPNRALGTSVNTDAAANEIEPRIVIHAVLVQSLRHCSHTQRR